MHGRQQTVANEDTRELLIVAFQLHKIQHEIGDCLVSLREALFGPAPSHEIGGSPPIGNETGIFGILEATVQKCRDNQELLDIIASGVGSRKPGQAPQQETLGPPQRERQRGSAIEPVRVGPPY